MNVVRLDDRLRAAPDRLVEREVRILHLKSDVVNAVTVLADVLGGRMLGIQRRGKDEPDLPLGQDVGGDVPIPGFQTAVGELGESKGLSVEIRRLLRVSGPEL